MIKFWRDILTEKDGETYELQRLFLFVSLIIVVAAFVIGCFYEYLHILKSPTAEFDLPSFYEGISYLLVSETILLGGGAASIFFKSKTETTDSK